MEISLQQVLEALIFASPKPLSTAELVAAVRGAGESSETDAAQALAQTTEGQVLEALASLEASLDQSGRAFRLLEQASGWGLVTRPEYAPWVRQLYPEAKPARLSGPALETLAIIAYRQPVTRADIEAVRGVAVDGVMQVLLDRSLVRISGRADQPGRPLLYATTDYFLEHFGLKTVTDLPNASELGRMPLPTAPPVEEKPAGRRRGRKGEETEPAQDPQLALQSEPADPFAPVVEPGDEPLASSLQETPDVPAQSENSAASEEAPAASSASFDAPQPLEQREEHAGPASNPAPDSAPSPDSHEIP